MKWAIRMPTRYAISEEDFVYQSEIQQIIQDYIDSHFAYDITNGQQLNIEEMTLGQLKAIYEK